MKAAAIALGAGVALMGAGITYGWADSSKSRAAAYPGNPSGTPASKNEGEPVKTDRSCNDASCPEKPEAASKGAARGPSTSDKGNTPSSSYPKSPTDTPSAGDASGKAPK